MDVVLNYSGGPGGVDGLMQFFYANRIPFEVDGSQAVSHITARMTDGSSTVGVSSNEGSNWQLMCNEIQEDIRKHPSVALLDTFKTTDDPSAIVWNAAQDRLNNGNSADPDFSGIDPGGLDLANAYFDVLIRGETHYALAQPVLKFQTTIGWNSASYRNDGGSETLMSTSAVLDETFPPAGIANAITSLPAFSPVGTLVWSWRRLPSTRSTVSGQRIEISTEYWLGYHSTFIYAFA
jgi:hypothetical protein